MTVKPSIPLLRPSTIPTRGEIEQRLYKHSPPLPEGLKQAYLSPIAEEVERMMLESGLEYQETDHLVNIVYRTGKDHYYYCGNCRFGAIHKSHNFCPRCGIKINWIK